MLRLVRNVEVPELHQVKGDLVQLLTTAYTILLVAGFAFDGPFATSAFMLAWTSQAMQVVTICDPLPAGGNKYVPGLGHAHPALVSPPPSRVPHKLTGHGLVRGRARVGPAGVSRANPDPFLVRVWHGVCLCRSVHVHVPVNRAKRGLEISQLVRAVARAITECQTQTFRELCTCLIGTHHEAHGVPYRECKAGAIAVAGVIWRADMAKTVAADDDVAAEAALESAYEQDHVNDGEDDGDDGDDGMEVDAADGGDIDDGDVDDGDAGNAMDVADPATEAAAAGMAPGGAAGPAGAPAAAAAKAAKKDIVKRVPSPLTWDIERVLLAEEFKATVRWREMVFRAIEARGGRVERSAQGPALPPRAAVQPVPAADPRDVRYGGGPGGANRGTRGMDGS